MSIDADLQAAGRILAGEGLVNAFGHVSVRVDDATMAITPPVPLGSLGPASRYDRLDFTAAELPSGMAKEAWIHIAIYRARPDVGAICRAQPEYATALASAGVPIRPLHGQGSFLGDRVPVFEDSRLVRDAERGEALAATLADADGLVMRGNGAVTVGPDLAQAVGRMWVLEKSARMNSIAASAGTPEPLPADQQEAWRDTAPELLGRIWTYLAALHDLQATTTSPEETHR